MVKVIKSFEGRKWFFFVFVKSLEGGFNVCKCFRYLGGELCKGGRLEFCVYL